MKNKLFSALGAVLFGLAVFFAFPGQSQAIGFAGAADCYCDTEVSGCFNDGDSAFCSSKKNCTGGRCKPKGDIIE